MNFDLFQYLENLAFIYVYGRLAIHFVPGIIYFFLNIPFNSYSQVDKPRILFNLVGLGFMHLMYFSQNTSQADNLFLQVITTIVFSLGLFFCSLSWSDKFEGSFLPHLKRSAVIPLENFNLSIPEVQIVQLYNALVQFDLLNQDLTAFEDFHNVLTKNWKDHNSKIHFKMDGPSCREFYDYFVKTYPKNSLTLKNMFISSKLIIRPDGKYYNYNTIKNAPTKTSFSKQNETLKNIFSKLA